MLKTSGTILTTVHSGLLNKLERKAGDQVVPEFFNTLYIRVDSSLNSIRWLYMNSGWLFFITMQATVPIFWKMVIYYYCLEVTSAENFH